MTLQHQLSACLALLFLMQAGCASNLPPPPPVTKQASPAPKIVPAPPPIPENEFAKQAEEQGDFQAAAQEYLRLAAIAPSAYVRTEYELRAVKLLIQGNLSGQAQRILGKIDAANLEPGQATRYQLFTARISLLEQQPEQALIALALPPSTAASPDLKIEFHELRAEAFAMLNQLANSIEERMAVDPLLPNFAAVVKNQQQIWQILINLSLPELTALRQQATSEAMRGWADLAIIAKKAEPDLPQQVERWHFHYPDHPAAEELVQSIAAMASQPPTQPQQIALLLPISGNFANSGIAIRDGFLTAHFSRTDQSYAPLIRVYDTNGVTDINILYQQAIAAGAEMIIGPLEKELVTQLTQQQQLPVPTLALNYAAEQATAAPAQLVQFGLAPEDEALQVAERAWLEAHNRAAVLFPRSAWGERLFTSFANQWRQFGGSVTATEGYSTDNADFSDVVKTLLNLDESEARYQKLSAYLKQPLKFMPRRRADIDFIFMTALPNQARQIRPQLRYYFAGDIPLYATSHVNSGSNTFDRDLDGILFCDIPFVLAGETTQPTLRSTVFKLWPNATEKYARLYALGIDSFNIIPRLSRLSAHRYERFNGETGKLGLDEKNHIRRQLVWARFVNGIPHLLEDSAAAR